MACLGNRRGRGRGASLIGKESSHVCVACWLLGCGKVLAARQNGTARASHKRHTIEPVTCERLHCAEADTAVASALDEAEHLACAAGSCGAPLLLGKLGGGNGDEFVDVI